MYLVFTTNFIFCVYDSLRQRLLVFPIPCLQGSNTIALPVQSLFSLFSCITFSICTRSSWVNYALRDEEAVYWVSVAHYEAVAVGN